LILRQDDHYQVTRTGSNTPCLRPLSPRFGGLALAVAVIAVETISVVLLQHRAHGEAFAALYLIGVLLSAALSELAFAIATSLVSAATLLYFHSGPYELQDGLAAALFLVVALSTNFVADLARRHG
jgi:K+-sensing histidine kinase KdpD